MIRPRCWSPTSTPGVAGFQSRSPKSPDSERVRLDMAASLRVGLTLPDAPVRVAPADDAVAGRLRRAGGLPTFTVRALVVA
jgi:hypothetical protein